MRLSRVTKLLHKIYFPHCVMPYPSCGHSNMRADSTTSKIAKQWSQPPVSIPSWWECHAQPAHSFMCIKQSGKTQTYQRIRDRLAEGWEMPIEARKKKKTTLFFSLVHYATGSRHGKALNFRHERQRSHVSTAEQQPLPHSHTQALQRWWHEARILYHVATFTHFPAYALTRILANRFLG